MPKQPDTGQIARDQTGYRYATRSPMRFVSYEKLAVGSSAVPLASVPDGADSVRLRVESNDIRWRGDGVADPSATDGELLKTTDGVLILENLGNDGLRALKFIQVSTGAVLHAVYYRVRA